MKLKELINNLDYRRIEDISDCEIKGISCSSHSIAPGYLFVAIKGTRYDGHNFVNQAINKGAEAVIIQEDLPRPFYFRSDAPRQKGKGLLPKTKVAKILVPDSQAALAYVCAVFFRHPAKKLKVIGITGTNGKTTVSYLIEKILDCAGYPSGVIGTINYRVDSKQYLAANTTPQADILQSFLQEIVLAKSKYAIIEVSSHALAQRRVDCVDFSSAIFTNLSREHLDYHDKLDNYFSCKSSLFERLTPDSWAIINADDPYGRKLAKKVKSRLLTFGIEHPAEIRAKNLKLEIDKVEFTAVTARGNMEIESSLIGRHNVYNILAAIGAAFVEDIDFSHITLGMKVCACISGRLERVDYGQDFLVFIDYAHTEDALKKVLQALRQINENKLRLSAAQAPLACCAKAGQGWGKIILVFGCGGDRDKAKRPKMGKVATALSDFAILTTDNPRSEDPRQIISDIIRGIDKKTKNYKVVLDRFQAIREALSIARNNDIVVIAGKGHESSQIFADKTIHFSDREAVEKILQKHR